MTEYHFNAQAKRKAWCGNRIWNARWEADTKHWSYCAAARLLY